MGGLPDNMAEILRAEEVFKVHWEDGWAPREWEATPGEVNYPPADKAAAR